jgi:hypothetical protein
MSSDPSTSEPPQPITTVESLLNSILGQLSREQASLLPKLKSEQVTQLIEIKKQADLSEHKRQLLLIWLTSGLGLFTLLAICFLCWLFLHFNQQQFLDKVLSAFLGGMAGCGFSLGLLFGGRKNRKP